MELLKNESIIGLSVTMPLKKDIVEIGEYVDELVKIVKVGNTMVILNGVKCVFNTDFYGLNHLISKHLPIL